MMMATRWAIVVEVLAVSLYVGAIVAGLRVRDFSSINYWKAPDESTAWIPPEISSVTSARRQMAFKYILSKTLRKSLRNNFFDLRLDPVPRYGVYSFFREIQ